MVPVNGDEKCDLHKLQAVAITQKFFEFVSNLEKDLRKKTEKKIVFRSNQSLGFPKTEIDKIDSVKNIETTQETLRLSVNFMGLVGQSSPLPTHYTEDLRGYTDDENTVKHFIDFFQHRIYENLIDVWRKYRLYGGCSFDDGFANADSILLSIVGTSRENIVSHGLNVGKFKRILPLVINSTVTASSLAKIIKCYLDISDVRLVENTERKIVLAKSEENRIGYVKSTLGKDVVLGNKIVSSNNSVEIIIGPIDYSEYVRVIGHGKKMAEIKNLVNTVSTENIESTVKIDVRNDSVPKLSLRKDCAVVLGRNAWIGRLVNGTTSIIN